MMLSTTISFEGGNKLTSTLEGMADFKGTRWKKQAFLKAGNSAMQILADKANLLAPKGKTGLARESIGVSRGSYNEAYRYDYAVFTTLSKTFLTKAPKDRKGRPSRYPFMLAAGIPAQTYTRISKNGVSHEVTRGAYPAQRFISKATQLTRSDVIDRFESVVLTELNKYVQKQAK